MKGEAWGPGRIILAFAGMLLILGIFAKFGLPALLPGLFAPTAGITGVAEADLGKLTKMTSADPTYCPTSYGCDKTAYTVTCQATTNPAGLDIKESAPTEDVRCTGIRFDVKNTGKTAISTITITKTEEDPVKTKGFVTAIGAGGKWSSDGRGTGTYSSLLPDDTIVFEGGCKYEGGQNSDNDEMTITINGNAPSAKPDYQTFTQAYNCTA